MRATHFTVSSALEGILLSPDTLPDLGLVVGILVNGAQSGRHN